MRIPPRLGSAEKAVLLSLTGGPDRALSWSRNDGHAIYENREWTEQLCLRLTSRGHLAETVEGSCARYTVTEEGAEEANRLRNELSGFTVTTGR